MVYLSKTINFVGIPINVTSVSPDVIMHNDLKVENNW